LSVEVTTIAGRYTLERVLGRGGMSTVYYATDGKLDRPVALKLLADHLSDDHAFRKRLLHEARVAARLSHPSIVQVYDAGEEGERPYIVMEYIEGETLAATLRRRHRLAPGEVVELALQICDGLAYAHAARLVHRDVKPQNLLITPAGDVKIADFGIARADGGTHATETGTILGTAAYLPPEQAAGKEATPAADLYSLGVVLYELLSGEQPYQFTSLPELLARQQAAVIRPLHELTADVPPALEQVVLRCLATDPRARPQSARELARELSGTGGGETRPLPAHGGGSQPTQLLAEQAQLTPAKTISLSRPRRRPRFDSASWGRRRRVLIPAVLVAAAALLTLILTLTLAGGENPPPARDGVPSVKRSNDPAQQARNLAAWLRAQAE
jgi:serine/threonine-protein kinase